MRYILTTPEFVEELKDAAHKIKRGKSISQSDALRAVAVEHRYDHWGHVMWCLKETNQRIANGFARNSTHAQLKAGSVLDEVENIVGLAVYGADSVVYFKTCMMFSTCDGDAWLLDVEVNHALCLCWRGKRQQAYIVEDDVSFLIEYDGVFSIDGDVFTVTSRNQCIGNRSVLKAYPTHHIDAFGRSCALLLKSCKATVT